MELHSTYSGYVYVYADIDGKDDVSFMINDDSTNTQTLGMGRPYIACGGYVNEGDKISVYAELPQGQAGSAHVYVNMLDQNVYEQGYAQISKDVMTTTELTGSSMKGTINASEDGLFYTSFLMKRAAGPHMLTAEKLKLHLSAMRL